MANRMSSSGWSQKNATKYRPKKSRRRQLGSTTSIEWITPLQDYKPRVTFTPVIPKAVCGHDSGRKTPAKSSRPNSGQCKLQGISNHSLTSSTSQAGLAALPKPLKLASRPSSSQRPHSRWSVTPSSSISGITPPQGFDLASYIKKNGTTQGIIIGRNGQRTSDDYFDAYLLQCEEAVANEQPEDIIDCEASSVDLSEESDLNDCAVNDRSAPLCWNEQLALSKCLRCVTPNISEKSTASELKLKDNLRVKLMLNEQCLLERSWVKALQELPPLLETKAITSGNERGQSTHQQNHVLEILLYSATHKAQQQLLDQLFTVCVVVHSPESVVCMFEELTARRVLSCVSVITVHLSESDQRCLCFRTEAAVLQSCNLNNVTVWYQQQRLLLFSAQLQPTGESLQADASAQQSELGFVDKVQQQLVKTRENERPPYLGPPDVPEKLFHKRISYFNQDEDEDRTDIAVISSYLPELRLMEGEGSQHISPSPPKQSTTIQREVSAKTTTRHSPNTLSYSSSSNKQAPKIIIVPSVSENISRHHRPLKKSFSDLLSEEKKNHRKTDRDSNAFSIIANNWIGHYF